MTDAETTAYVAARYALIPFTPAQLLAAREIRTHYGWYDVLTVDALTVTVSGDFGDYKIPKTVILEVK